MTSSPKRLLIKHGFLEFQGRTRKPQESLIYKREYIIFVLQSQNLKSSDDISLNLFTLRALTQVQTFYDRWNLKLLDKIENNMNAGGKFLLAASEQHVITADSFQSVC